MNLRMPEPDLHNPITGSRIKQGGKTHLRLVNGGFLNMVGEVTASTAKINEEKKRAAAVATERSQRRRVLVHGSVEERIDLALTDIKTPEQAVLVTGKVCRYVRTKFDSDIIKDLSEGIGALNVSGAHL